MAQREAKNKEKGQCCSWAYYECKYESGGLIPLIPHLDIIRRWG